MRAAGVGTALVAAVLLAVGCSSGGGSAASSPSPSGSAAICADVSALRASVSQLGHITPSSNALATLKTDLAQVKKNLATLRTDAGTEWKTQINDLGAALTKLQKTLTSLGSQSSAAAAAAAVSADLAGVTTAGSNLLRTASTRCPSASASSSA
ncbi:MAG TPA: hypothetical protein VMV92_29090 [Streptosporangiaceae bacterium]|nr:hypothetical protein [Streptosporangiaceae bacterium]